MLCCVLRSILLCLVFYGLPCSVSFCLFISTCVMFCSRILFDLVLIIYLFFSLSLALEPPGNRYRHRLSLLRGGKAQEQKGLDLDRRVLRLVRAACWAVQVQHLPSTQQCAPSISLSTQPRPVL